MTGTKGNLQRCIKIIPFYARYKYPKVFILQLCYACKFQWMLSNYAEPVKKNKLKKDRLPPGKSSSSHQAWVDLGITKGKWNQQRRQGENQKWERWSIYLKRFKNGKNQSKREGWEKREAAGDMWFGSLRFLLYWWMEGLHHNIWISVPQFDKR